MARSLSDASSSSRTRERIADGVNEVREPDPDPLPEGRAGSTPSRLALPAPPADAERLFGRTLGLARRYAELLATDGVQRGLIGPREVPRIWERHLINCALVHEIVPAGSQVLDVGSGAGLPGIPLSIVRPDLMVTLLEPLERRATFLVQAVTELSLSAQVLRARAEESRVRAAVVTARAVAPLHRLVPWCLPHLAPGGVLLAIKGRSATDEVRRDAAALRAAGAEVADIVSCGAGWADTPTTVVVIGRSGTARGKAQQ